MSTPIFDAMARYVHEESEALIAYQAHNLVVGVEAILLEASEG